MFHTYLVTGASGFLGRAVLAELKKKGVPIRALVMENDPLAAGLPEGVSVFYGDVCDDASLERFFSGADNGTCVIHCAGIVSVASRPGERIYQVNVGGTSNILRHCERARVGKLVYVSSVHAIPEKPKGTEITEDAVFSPDAVRGDYAKSKGLPVNIHLRDAMGDFLDVVREHPGLRGNMHAYSGSYESFLELQRLGDWYIGVGGVVTFKNASLAEVVKKVPLERIVLETDAPYLTPVPYRGKRNESSYIPIIAAKVAELKDISVEEVAETTTNNAKNLFGI